jgi:hypothetical protein
MYKINNAEVGSAVSVRPSATALFTVNSADRYGGNDVRRQTLVATTPYDFTIRKNESLLNGFFTRMGITEISFPMSLPNCDGSSSRMAILYTPAGGVEASSIFTAGGFFTPAEISAALQVKIRSLDPSFATATVQYGANGLPQFIITMPAGATVSFAPIATTGGLPFPYNQNQIQMYDMFGFTLANALAQQNVVIGNFTYFQKYQYLDIVSTLLTGNQNLKDSTTAPIDRNILCRLYVDYENSYNVPPFDPLFAPAGTTPFTIYRKFPIPKFVQWDVKQPVGQLNFQVFDQDGFLIKSDPQFQDMDWKMSMLVSEQ